MSNKLPSDLWNLSVEALNNSERWFGESGVAADISHMSLSMCGEAGNLANIIKLIDRGEIDPKDARAHFDMVMALADVFVYVLNIAAILQIDLLRAYEQKVIANEKRFVDDREKKNQPIRAIGWQSYSSGE